MTDPDEMTEGEIVEEINELNHTAYTCDRLGTKTQAEDERRKEALKDALDGEYEHDPDTCEECRVEREILDRQR